MAIRHPALLDRNRSALVVIDMQEAFAKIIPDFAELSERIARLVQAANLLKLPVIITEQYPKGLGRTVQAIAQHFQDGGEPIEKLSFSERLMTPSERFKTSSLSASETKPRSKHRLPAGTSVSSPPPINTSFASPGYSRNHSPKT